ncbi:MAG: AraC family transcriptional regulator [Thermomicrobiales bacterium]
MVAQDMAAASRDARADASMREELAQRIRERVTIDGRREDLDGLVLRRVSAPTPHVHGVSFSSFCVIAQGVKEIAVGEEVFRYDPENYLIATSELPISTAIVEATTDDPFLGVVIRLDPLVVSSVLAECGDLDMRGQAPVKAIDVSALDGNLLDAVVRYVRLLDAPAEAPFLAPLIQREIVFRLLMGTQGWRLRQLTATGGAVHRIARAIDLLRRDVATPIRIEAMAQELGMSVSSFHHHFKAVTAMSPLQFQKHLRLQEARRLMLGEDLDAASAGFRVGYDDASHFNREYKRLFGEPPMRDIERLRGAGPIVQNAGLYS